MVRSFLLAVSLLLSGSLHANQSMPVEMRNAQLSELVAYVTETLKVPVFMDDALSKKTVTFVNAYMTEDDALWYLEKVVTQSGLSFVHEKGAVFITSREQSGMIPGSLHQPGAQLDKRAELRVETEPLISEVVVLSRASVEQAEVITQSLLEQHTTNFELKEGYAPPFSVLRLPSGDGLLITGYRYQLEHVKGVIKALSVSERQLSVQAIVYETVVDHTDTAGFQLAIRGSSGLLQLGSAASVTSPSFLADLVSGDLSALLTALSSEAETKVLSNPTVTVTQGERAYISVGQKVPFIVGTEVLENGREIQRIERQDVGLTLDVQPNLLPDGRVQIKVNQTASTLARSSVGAADLITNQRVLQTSLILQPNQIYSLGGLIQEQENGSTNSVPVLSDLPFIGSAFSSDSRSSNRTMLNVLIKVSEV